MREYFFCIVIGLVLYTSCNIVDRKTMLHIPMKEKGFTINVDYVAVGATSKDVIQITKLTSDGQSAILRNLDVHDTILGYSYKGDTMLSLIFFDTAYMSIPGKLDTIDVKIN